MTAVKTKNAVRRLAMGLPDDGVEVPTKFITVSITMHLQEFAVLLAVAAVSPVAVPNAAYCSVSSLRPRHICSKAQATAQVTSFCSAFPSLQAETPKAFVYSAGATAFRYELPSTTVAVTAQVAAAVAK